MIKKLLTGGLHSKDFHLFLQEQYPEIDCVVSKSTEETTALLKEVDAVAGFNFIPKADLSHIKWIHSFGAGIDSFLQHKLSSDLLLTKTTGGMGRRIAEYCLTYILNNLQQFQYFQELQKKKIWRQHFLPELKDITVYVFGTGFVGEAIGKLLLPLTKEVIGINTSGNAKKYFSKCISLKESGKIAFEARAVVINALPLTDDTKGLMNSRLFIRMKEVLLINIGRGATITEADLINALENKQLQQAVLDVFTEEPLPNTNCLWNHPQVIITPHISGITNFTDIQSSFSAVYEAMKGNQKVPNQISLEAQY